MNHKKLVKVLLTILVVISISFIGCTGENEQVESVDEENSSKEEQYTEQNTNENSDIEDLEKKRIEILTETYEESIKDEEDDIIIQLEIIYPQIKNTDNEESIKKINEYYKKEFDDFVNTIKSDYVDMAKEEKEYSKESGYEFRPYSFGRNFEVYYDNNDKLSIRNLQYEDTGGAHPNSYWFSENFDITTGELFTLGDVLYMSEEEALELVYTTVTEKIKESEGSEDFMYFDTYESDVREYYNKEDFLITEDGIMVYYQAYAIAPYAAGIPTFIVKN